MSLQFYLKEITIVGHFLQNINPYLQFYITLAVVTIMVIHQVGMFSNMIIS